MVDRPRRETAGRLASRCRFYEDEELADLARQAGLSAAAVVHHDGGQLLVART